MATEETNEDYDRPSADDMSIPSSVEHGERHRVENVEKGFRLKMVSTRGTSVRDDDKVVAEGHFEDLGEANAARVAMRDMVDAELAYRRGFQPDDGRLGEEDVEELHGKLMDVFEMMQDGEVGLAEDTLDDLVEWLGTVLDERE